VQPLEKTCFIRRGRKKQTNTQQRQKQKNTWKLGGPQRVDCPKLLQAGKTTESGRERKPPHGGTKKNPRPSPVRKEPAALKGKGKEDVKKKKKKAGDKRKGFLPIPQKKNTILSRDKKEKSCGGPPQKWVRRGGRGKHRCLAATAMGEKTPPR